MYGIMNENQLTIVKEYEFDNPPNTRLDSPIDNSVRDCHLKYFHTFDHICEYDSKFTKITNNESLNFKTSDKNMNLYDLNKKLPVARQIGYIFNQIYKLSIKIYSNLSNKIIHYHLRLGAPPLHRQFFIKNSKNKEYIPTYCNDRRNSFHFACRQWYSYNNPQNMLEYNYIYSNTCTNNYNCKYSNLFLLILVQISIITCIHIQIIV